MWYALVRDSDSLAELHIPQNKMVSLAFEPAFAPKFLRSSKILQVSSVTIPRSVECIDVDCFRNCMNLHKVTFESGSSLKTIGESAFSCTSLSEVAIPSSVHAELIGCDVTRI